MCELEACCVFFCWFLRPSHVLVYLLLKIHIVNYAWAGSKNVSWRVVKILIFTTILFHCLYSNHGSLLFEISQFKYIESRLRRNRSSYWHSTLEYKLPKNLGIYVCRKGHAHTWTNLNQAFKTSEIYLTSHSVHSPVTCKDRSLLIRNFCLNSNKTAKMEFNLETDSCYIHNKCVKYAFVR